MIEQISTDNLEEAKKLIKKKNRPIIIEAQTDLFNRKILEYGKFDILTNIELQPNRKDKPKHLDSGLNHVLAKIASKNKISIGIDLNKLRNLDKKDKAKTLARIKQNIKVCRKAKTHLKILNYQDKKDAFSFLLTLGSSTAQAKKAITF